MAVMMMMSDENEKPSKNKPDIMSSFFPSYRNAFSLMGRGHIHFFLPSKAAE